MALPVWTKDVEVRTAAIERVLEEVWSLLKNAINKEQFNRLNVIRQREMINLVARIDALTTRVETLETKLDSLI